MKKNKVGTTILYVVTSPLWIPVTLITTLVFMKAGIVTFSDIFSKDNKKNHREEI